MTGAAGAVLEMRQIYLMPGALHCALEPTLITTILGSCIALCLWDGVRRIGGMNHYVLPHGPEGGDGRYGEKAIGVLLDTMLGMGSRVRDLRAKLLGGATVLPSSESGATVGELNLQVAVQMLKHRRIPVMARRTGGRHGMLVRFDTSSGEVAIRRIGPDAGMTSFGTPADAPCGT